MPSKKKRSRNDFESEGDVGRSAELPDSAPDKKIKRDDGRPAPRSSHDADAADGDDCDDDDQSERKSSLDGWTVVSSKRRQKKPKTSHPLQDLDAKPDVKHSDAQSYPRIYHVNSLRQEAALKLEALQKLVLYLLADGDAPQFVAVQSHHQVERVVVLMAPGLDAKLLRPLVKTSQRSATATDYKSSNPFSSLVKDESLTEETISTNGQEHAPVSDEEHPNQDSNDPDHFLPTKLSANDLRDPLKPMASVFDNAWPVSCAGDNRHYTIHSAVSSILTVPIRHDKLDKGPKGSGPQLPAYSKDWADDPRPVTDYIATLAQLRADEYDIHPNLLSSQEEQIQEIKLRRGRNHTSEHGWVDADVASSPSAPEWDGSVEHLDNGQDIIALDCEMCQTASDHAALTRVSAMSWNGTLLLDELVKPSEPITNYVTQFSGITKDMLDPVTTTLQDIQARLLKIFTPNSILVGHSLNSDLAALKMTHPRVVDSAMLYPHPRGPPYKNGLKFLTQRYLQREIQNQGPQGHDPTQDAHAALDLVRLKCSRGPEWGTPDAGHESIFKRLRKADPPVRSAMIDWANPARGGGADADFHVPCTSDADVTAGIATTLADPARAPTFMFARLRELAALRGWWPSSKHADAEALRAATCTAHLGGPRVADPHAHDAARREGAHLTRKSLDAAVARTVSHIAAVHEALPPRTAFFVYTGGGDPRAVRSWAARHRAFEREFRVKKWDELSVQWTQRDENAQKAAYQRAKMGLAFMTVK